MLYNQGMIIPGHPNNTGVKPLLIGLPDQIDAQLNYIHRGNYGLLSIDELRAAGASEEKARELMRIKLSFAFGSLRPISELLDSLAVDHRKIEIRNGVYLHRTGLNKYRIEYEEESAEVDMELAKEARYVSPYPLGIRQTSREFFSIIHSGDGDGWDIDRPCMSSVVSLQGRLYLIDAGPNLETILNSLSISVNELSGIFHTHSHDDHFCGLSALLHADHKLTHFATPVVRASIAKKFAALLGSEDDLFESFFECVDLKPGVWNSFDGFDVYPIESPHPVETTAFRFRVLGLEGYRTYAHLADIAAQSVLNGMVTEDDKAPGITAAYCAKIKKLYGARADLKKIDIGGGLIHGDSADFADDQSGKIVFSHVARPLTTEEKQTGSGADFGTEDVLIPNIGLDYFKQIAVESLRAYFPDQSLVALQILLNNEI
ncbi:MAG: MBL fold metallo-hydrolase [Proteobacteria bacterium]|nr:MBL fold metallo-hydrolase [Pseudomonadota bacterium]